MWKKYYIKYINIQTFIFIKKYFKNYIFKKMWNIWCFGHTFTPTCHIPHKLYLMYFIHLYGRGVGLKVHVLLLLCLFSRDIVALCAWMSVHSIVNVRMGLLWKQGHYTHIYATAAVSWRSAEDTTPERGLQTIRFTAKTFVCVCMY